jgi:hypothetical protein
MTELVKLLMVTVLADGDEKRAERSARAFGGIASGTPVPNKHFMKRLLEVASEAAHRARKQFQRAPDRSVDEWLKTGDVVNFFDPALVDDFFDACRSAYQLLGLPNSDFLDYHLKTVNAFWMLTRDERERLVRHVESLQPEVYLFPL